MTAQKNLSCSVYYQEAAEGGYVASVPALGETPEEAELNVAEAIGLYLESLSAHGEAAPDRWVRVAA